MMPGFGGRMDPRRMSAMMRQLGINVQEIEGVTEVIIRTPAREYLFSKPDVTLMTASGQKTYQVVGNPRVVEKGGAAPVAPAAAPAAAPAQLEILDEDVAMVAEQAGVPQEKARAALKATNGDIAEAILKLQGGKK